MSDMSIKELENSDKPCSINVCSAKAAFIITMPDGDDVLLCEVCASECFGHLMDKME